MVYPIARQRRGATNVEYILLMICAALAVTLGVSVLSNAMMLKHIQVAEALSAVAVGTQEVASTFESAESTITDNGNGSITIAVSGSGVPPYSLIKDDVQVAEDNAPVFIVPKTNGTYEVRDAAGHTSLPVVVSLPAANIVIDGTMTDWAPLVSSPTGHITDTIEPTDPDPNGQPSDDLYLLSAYGDTSYLYLHATRVAGGSANAFWTMYLDIDADGRMEAATDFVLVVNTRMSSVLSTTLYRYGGVDDPINGDGSKTVGSLGSSVAASTTTGYAADRSAIECRVPWSALGVAGRVPTRVKWSMTSGITLPSMVIDNTPSMMAVTP